MVAGASQLDLMCRKLRKAGNSAFLATTLSTPLPMFEAALERLGQWIRSKWEEGPVQSEAFCVGIHLEGPFLAQSCCGAHPPECLLDPSLELLQKWWELSGRTLARITLAPERGAREEVQKILKFCRKNAISVSLGHSQASGAQAEYWHRQGIRNLTHAWNAMPFHHRDPGILGAYLGRADTWVELIADGVHVADPVLGWTHTIHPDGVFWVSDCVPAGQHEGPCSFGPLEIRADGKVCRTPQGHLAGGALTLAQLGRDALKRKAVEGISAARISQWTAQRPWKALGLTPQRTRWMRGLSRLHRA